MRGVQWVVLALAAAWPAWASAQQEAPANRSLEVPTYKSIRKLSESVTLGELSNGLTVIVQEYKVAPVATVRCYVRNTGSAFEGKYLGAGLSHVLEHVVSGGTNKKRTEKEIRNIIERFGGISNAYTTDHLTAYYIDCPAENVMTCIELVADSMQHITFEPGEFARELKVVNRELADGEVNRGRVQWKLLHESIYTQHPARVPTIGYQQVLNATTNDKIIDFYHSRYVPNNQIFVVVGDVNTKAVLDQVARQWIGTHRGTETLVAMNEEPEQLAPRETWQEMDGNTYDMVFAWPTVKLSHEDLYALDVAAYILAEGESSRMAKKLKYEEAVVQSVSSASFTPHYVKGFFAIFASSTPDTWQQASEEILKEVYRLKTEPVGAAELAKAKKQKAAELVFGHQTVQQMSDGLGRSLISSDDPLFDEQYVKKIQEVTAEQIQAVAKKYFVPDRLNRVVISPPPSPLAAWDTNSDGKLSADEVAAGFKKLDKDGDGKLIPPEVPANLRSLVGPVWLKLDKNQDRALSLDEFQPLAAAAVLPKRNAATAANDSSGETKRYVLDNGLRVLVRRVPHLPLVNLQAYTIGAGLVETPKDNGLATLVASMLDQGTKHHTADDIAEYFDSIGGQFGVSAGRNTVYASASVLKDDLHEAASLFAEALLEPTFPAERFEVIKQQHLAAIAQRDADPQSEIFELFSDNLPASSPYSLVRGGKADTVGKLTPDDCRAYHHKYFVPENMVVTIYGDIEPEAAVALAKQHFGGLKPDKDFTKPNLKRPNTLAESSVHHKQTRKPTGMVLVGYPMMDIYDQQEYAAMQVLDGIMSGSGGWLFKDLREKREIVYYVFGMPLTGPAPGYYLILTQTSPETVAEAVGAIRENVQRARSGKITREEFELARDKLIGQHAQRNTSISAQAQEAALNELYGLGFDYDAGFAQRIRAVKLEDVQRVARKVFGNSLLVTSSPAAESPVAGGE